MNDDDLRRLLRSIDGADDDVPPQFADELWYEVRDTIVRGRPTARRRPTQPVDLVDRSPGRSRRGTGQPERGRGRTRTWQARVAVLVLLIGGVTGLVLASGDPAPRTSDAPDASLTVPTDPSPPILDDPAEACRRFETAGPLAELLRSFDDVESETTSVVAELDIAVAALEVYVRDLEAAADASPSAITESDVAPIRRALDSLQQAQLEVEIGELDRARRSVEAAASLIIEVPTPWC